ncbi:enoyl-CoA hydratase/isomerase family protein [Limnohabitans radicicola]|uniref:Enoyl-CoA hydratase/isomerase family protein n=1 Tax=Limnohabitans radicicola TaxID=2771427 RepID=A0A927ILE4_9BURK|nr:enoyl-CoA hydratase/isomerase family protein [Limnohabitans radicicola]MBD8050075.1 enoyl-CoA hydratase/isomerase family protein [Limnohabitans radicicola]
MLRTERDGPWWVLWLDAPASRNALTDAMVSGLQQALNDAAQDPSVRAVLLRGAGGTFCAGGDFSRFRTLMAEPAPAQGPDPIAVFNRAFGAMLDVLAGSPVLTMACIEGAAMGGGCGLAAACDVVLATDTAVLATPEVTLGLPPAQIAPFVAARLGERQALRLMASAQRVNATEAQRIGLVDEVVPQAELPQALAAWQERLRRAEPQALRATKAILSRRRVSSLGETLDFAAEAFARSLRSGTASEGLAALGAKRAPAWATPKGLP